LKDVGGRKGRGTSSRKRRELNEGKEVEGRVKGNRRKFKAVQGRKDVKERS
jgi:hypothetical protein